MIAALFVQTDGCYAGLPHVDPWPIERDARTYAGPWPAVAHPPCQRWARFAESHPITGKQFIPGNDGGCFHQATWLYAFGVDLPDLIWGRSEQRLPAYAVERYGYEKARRIGAMAAVGGKDKIRIREATPPDFRDLLLSIVATATPSPTLTAAEHERIGRQDNADPR